MKIEQSQWTSETKWEPALSSARLGADAQVVFLFGSVKALSNGAREGVRRAYPNACLFGCSTAGEIQGASVRDDTLALTALAFENTRVATARVRIDSLEKSFEAGASLVKELNPAGLRHVVVLSEGLKVNASELVNGINSALPPGVGVSGGCAGDGNRLQTTFVWADGEPEQSAAVALGFYGERLQVGVSAVGGWSPFGPDRLITRSRQNVLYEIDGRPALALYKQYLGQYAEGLPATGLLFPLELSLGNPAQRVLRALLAVNDEEQSITFAGNMPEGAYARFMIGHMEDLIQSTQVAARASLSSLKECQSQFSLIVSCNGRRFVLKQRIEEEIESAREALGPRTTMTGFYSYGEIAPTDTGSRPELHNETMTITSFSEA